MQVRDARRPVPPLRIVVGWTERSEVQQPMAVEKEAGLEYGNLHR
jgi:hypothetical protein